MKKIKHSRKIGYALAGLTIGVVVFLLMQSRVPLPVEARSTLAEFASEQASSEYVLDNEDYNGYIKPFLEFGSYRVTASEFNDYELNGTVTYGKINPTYFFESKPVVVEETPELEVTESSEGRKTEESSENEESATAGPVKENKYPTITENSSNDTGGNTLTAHNLEGFNIHTRTLETVDVSGIEEEFRKYGVIPLEDEHYNISSTFGEREDPFEKTVAYHVGLDLASDTINQANIYSALGGEVLEAVTGDTGLGNYIVIKHDGFETLYAHMIEPTRLEVGDIVKAGDQVGFVGNTGRSTGPHLHFEVGIGGLKLDPEVFLSKIERAE